MEGTKTEMYTVIFLGFIDAIALILVFVSIFINSPGLLFALRVASYFIVAMNTITLFIISVYRYPAVIKCYLKIYSPEKYYECYVTQRYRWVINRALKEADEALREIKRVEEEIIEKMKESDKKELEFT